VFLNLLVQPSHPFLKGLRLTGCARATALKAINDWQLGKAEKDGVTASWFIALGHRQISAPTGRTEREVKALQFSGEFTSN
jgi:hypothetical protein